LKEVKPQRDLVKRRSYRENWWQFAERCPGLYRAIAPLKAVIVIAQVTKPVAFAFTDSRQVLDAKLVVIASSSAKVFAFLQSNLHHYWAWKYCTTLESRLSYTPTTIFETFPFPAGLSSSFESKLEQIGEHYHEHRRQLMLKVQLGLTKTYNLFHDPEIGGTPGETTAWLTKHLASTPGTFSLDEAVAGIEKLRKLHVELDHAVLAAYGWDQISDAGPALDLGHSFHKVDYLPENDRVRFTIHPDARKEVLKRLLQLNHKLYAEEEAKGLHKKRPGKNKETDDNGQQPLL
jgi:hypothetical protein